MNWLLSDIDQTLIYPRHRYPFPLRGDERTVFQREGQHHRAMLMPPAVEKMVCSIGERYVAVTARAHTDVTKLAFPFEWDYVIASFGAEIYRGNRLLVNFMDMQKADRLRRVFDACLGHPAYSEKWLRKPTRVFYSGEKSNIPSIIEFKLKEEKSAAAFAEAIGIDRLQGLSLQVNGSTLTLHPVGVTKENAVAWLIEHCIRPADEQAYLIGAGDSISDMPFMQLCDLSLQPTGSQIFQTVY